jgi:uncharacterized protein
MERSVAEGGYFARVAWNATHGVAQRAFDLVASGRPFKVLATFYLGLAAARWELWSEPRVALLRRVLLVGALVGIPLNLGLAVMMQTSAYERLLPIGFLQPLLYSYGVPALALSYASAFTLSFRNERFARFASATLAKVGRLSLSNYLLQSLLGVVIYDRFAGGLFGKLGTVASLLVAMAVFLVQIALSALWLLYFKQGPFEWAWRALTYGRRGSLPARAPDRLATEGWVKR